MKILVICQYYSPEPFRLNDVCEALAAEGHEVTVVTGTPNYPEGKIYPGYGKGRLTDETLNGVKVHRCPIVPRRTGGFFRILNYYSFPLTAKRYVRSEKCAPEDGKAFDVVFVNQLSPVMMARPAFAYRKKRGAPVVLYCLDLWPESVIAGGLSRNDAAFGFFMAESEKIYRQADSILVSSGMFAPYLTENFGIAPEKISYLPQYAEDMFGTAGKRSPGDVINLTFAGNIGAVQDVETIIGAAGLTRDLPVKYHIAGGGTDLERVKALAAEKGLENVTFYGRLPLSDMPELYGRSDAMLITMKGDPALCMTLPGKVQSYMAAGKPVIGAIDGETARVISEADCGFVSPAGDAAALAANIRSFASSDRKEELGRNARAYYEAHFGKQVFIKKLVSGLERAAGK